jgi:hypothetical protein
VLAEPSSGCVVATICSAVLACRQQSIWRGAMTWLYTLTSLFQRYHVQVS